MFHIGKYLIFAFVTNSKIDLKRATYVEKEEKTALTKSMSKVNSLDILWKGSKYYPFPRQQKHLICVLRLHTHLAAIRPPSNLFPRLMLTNLIAPDFAHLSPNAHTRYRSSTEVKLDKHVV